MDKMNRNGHWGKHWAINREPKVRTTGLFSLFPILLGCVDEHNVNYQKSR